MKKLILILFTMVLFTGYCKAQTINYETATIVMTTINTALTTLNASGITPKWQTQYTAGLAVLTGAGQLAYGIYEAGSSMTTLDAVNIAAGTATIITNAILLYKTFHSGSKKTAWNVYYTPLADNKSALGITLVKKF